VDAVDGDVDGEGEREENDDRDVVRVWSPRESSGCSRPALPFALKINE
jgi:hypothetical protein